MADDIGAALKRKQGKLAAKKRETTTKSVPAADAEQTVAAPEASGEDDVLVRRRSRTTELERSGRQGISMSVNADLWRRLGIEATNHGTSKSVLLEVLVRRHIEDDSDDRRAAVHDEARDVSRRNRRRR